jgi:hypothetical protein
MARIRYLKPEFFSDEDLAELPFQARLTFAGLWCYADKAGRLEDRPKFLKAMIFPYDNVDMEKQLDMLNNRKHENGTSFIQRYDANGVKLIQIVKWDKHQRPHHTERESNFPPAPPLKNKENGNGKPARSELDLSNGELTVKRPLNKLTDDEFLLKLKENSAYKEAELNIDFELGEMDSWLLAHEDRKKTREFIIRWLNKNARKLMALKPQPSKEKAEPVRVKDADGKILEKGKDW